MRRTTKMAIIGVVVVALIVVGGIGYITSWTNTPAQAPSISNTCTYPGQSMGLFLQVLSDSNSTMVGASVAGLYEFPYTCIPNSTLQSTTSQTIQTFTTNNTEWYRLNGINDGTYSLAVTYAGHGYNLTAQLRPSTYTCATLYVPSGRTDVAYGPASCEVSNA